MEHPSQRNVVSANTGIIVPDRDKAQAEKHKHIGNAQMSAKHYEQAIDSYTKAASLNPYDPAYWSNRAAAYSMAGEYHEAVKDAEKAIKLDPSFVKAYKRLGSAQYSLGNYSLAVSSFKRGLTIDPTNSALQQASRDATEACIGAACPHQKSGLNSGGSTTGSILTSCNY